MLVEGEPAQAAVAQEGAPVVDGIQPTSAGNEAPSGTDTPKLPGWTGQLTVEQQAEIKARVAADPKAIDELPKGLTELYSSFSQLKAQAVGALKVPAADAPKEAWDQFYKGLGRPESAEGYTLEKPQVPAGMRYDEAQEKWFRGLVHALGLNQTQAKGVYDEWNKREVATFQKVIEARKSQAKAAIDSLKQEWGNKYEENWAKMQLAYSQFIPGGNQGQLFKKIQAHGLDNDPDFLKMLKSIGDKIGPPRTVVPKEVPGSSAESGGWSIGASLKS
jgi:hypothetical protein